MKKGHLTDLERDRIAIYLQQGLSHRQIGLQLDRHNSTISEEINKNKGPDGTYYPSLAQKKADQRISTANSANSRKKPGVWNYVKEKLIESWSPDQISHRIEADTNHYVCAETIYRYIYASENKHLTLWVYLRRKQPKRVKKRGRKVQKSRLKNRVFIGQRELAANQRSVPGHWETDLMEGSRREKDCVSVSCDRKTRYILLTKVNSKSAQDKTESLINQLGKFPSWLKRTITSDNGLEHTRHEQISKELNIKYYFCHPYSSWERGTVENSIGLLREFLPKKKSLRQISQRDLNLLSIILNNRPRKSLGYLTPQEAMIKEINARSVGIRY